VLVCVPAALPFELTSALLVDTA